MRKVQTDFISQPCKTRENLQLRDDTVSSQAVMIKQDSASFADSSCHSSPVGSAIPLSASKLLADACLWGEVLDANTLEKTILRPDSSCPADFLRSVV